LNEQEIGKGFLKTGVTELFSSNKLVQERGFTRKGVRVALEVKSRFTANNLWPFLAKLRHCMSNRVNFPLLLSGGVFCSYP
jgi:hypothetical protein